MNAGKLYLLIPALFSLVAPGIIHAYQYSLNWSATTPFPENATGGFCIASNATGSIYCIGVNYISYGRITAGNLSYYAAATDSGASSWTQTTEFPLNTSIIGCGINNTTIVCIGKPSKPQSNSDYYASISAGGIGKWSATMPLPGKFSSSPPSACVPYSDSIYCMYNDNGAYNGASGPAYIAHITGSGIGSWSAATAPYNFSTSAGSCAAYNSTIYCLGYNNNEAGIQDAVLYYASINRSGTGAWRPTGYPEPYTGQDCFASGNLLYCMNLATGGVVNGSYRKYNASISVAGISAGYIGAWITLQTSSNPLPLAFSSPCIPYGTTIYCIEQAQQPSGPFVDSVYYIRFPPPSSSTPTTTSTSISSSTSTAPAPQSSIQTTIAVPKLNPRSKAQETQIMAVLASTVIIIILILAYYLYRRDRRRNAAGH